MQLGPAGQLAQHASDPATCQPTAGLTRTAATSIAAAKRSMPLPSDTWAARWASTIYTANSAASASAKA